MVFPIPMTKWMLVEIVSMCLYRYEVMYLGIGTRIDIVILSIFDILFGYSMHQYRCQK